MSGPAPKLGNLGGAEPEGEKSKKEPRIVWVSGGPASLRPPEPAKTHVLEAVPRSDSMRFDVESPELLHRLRLALLIGGYITDTDEMKMAPASRNALLDVAAMKYGGVLTHYLPELKELCGILHFGGGLGMGRSIQEVAADQSMREDSESLLLEMTKGDGSKVVRVLPLGSRILEAIKAFRMLGREISSRAMPPVHAGVASQLKCLIPEKGALNPYENVDGVADAFGGELVDVSSRVVRKSELRTLA
ncbi:hypothetical protein HY605_00445 [Candidatus Peregrinibacteria bacterium]|nr:hypothetical protein [Candidatus Peregrinibacteria bacterium]